VKRWPKPVSTECLPPTPTQPSMSGMTSSSKVVDLDARLGFEADTPVHTKRVKMLGKEWTLVCDVNSFAVSDILSGDAGGIARFIKGIILPAEVDAFTAWLAKLPNFDGEKLGKLLNVMIEEASERPTVSPSPVRRTANKQTSGRNSTPA